LDFVTNTLYPVHHEAMVVAHTYRHANRPNVAVRLPSRPSGREGLGDIEFEAKTSITLKSKPVCLSDFCALWLDWLLFVALTPTLPAAGITLVLKNLQCEN
jgi:hypothetical protein